MDSVTYIYSEEKSPTQIFNHKSLITSCFSCQHSLFLQKENNYINLFDRINIDRITIFDAYFIIKAIGSYQICE